MRSLTAWSRVLTHRSYHSIEAAPEGFLSRRGILVRYFPSRKRLAALEQRERVRRSKRNISVKEEFVRMYGVRSLIMIIAAAALLTTSSELRAQDFFDELFGPATPSPQRAVGTEYSYPQYSGAVGRSWKRRQDKRHVEHESTFRKAAKANAEARKAAEVNAEAEVSQVEWFCVRTCDGYYFPQIKSGGTTKQQSCEHACPSAPMAVYEGSTIEAASSLTGEKYTSLPAAFSFRSNTTQNCSCSPQGRARSFSMRTLSEDPTLRTGDIVFGDRGAFVYQHSKLAPLERSFLLSPKTREKIRSLLVAGRTRPQADVNELQSSTGPSAHANS